jgi:invasion protein IalB
MARALLVGALACLGVGIASNALAITRTEKTFGSWIVNCVEDNNQQKSCSLRTRAMTQEKKVAFIWNVGMVDKQLKSQLLVPSGVSLQEGVRFSIGTASPTTIVYNTCGPNFCSADLPLDTALLTKIKAAQKASVNFVTGAKKLVQIELDITEFPKAYDYFYAQVPK